MPAAPHATDSDETGRRRPPGVLPRPVVALAAVALAGATGVAMWLLPGPPALGGDAASGSAADEPLLTSAAERIGVADRRLVAAAPLAGPDRFTAFVDATARPRFDLVAAHRRTGTRWFTLGHVTAGPGDCTPRWGGAAGRTVGRSDPMTRRVSALHAAGGGVTVAFGGPAGPSLAAVCPDARRLLAAYRHVVDAFGLSRLAFEFSGPLDPTATARHAKALRVLIRKTERRGGQLRIDYTFPAGYTGLSAERLEQLRAAHRYGVPIDTVGLLVPLRRAETSRPVHLLSQSARAARDQIATVLDVPRKEAMRRIALIPVLSSPADLDTAEARALRSFAVRHHLARLSLRGAQPRASVRRVLS
ncbi:hypothetical protein [Thermostaphylospora chromogena]|uniref:Chitinase n=1 Tax=Thermostaphylospora chromogena TaxID=35622 RepID=A0A1H1HXW5_9ACTN|nr:hypothetical protein [Thermostaphylospora chromogena]SDR30307.1 hypothetical protein SAMN04489764_4950 [Thermostaphylospora chromogena]